MAHATHNAVIEIGGLSIQSSIIRTESAQLAAALTLPVAKAAVNWTAATSTITVADDDAIAAGDWADVFWYSSTSGWGCRYGCDVVSITPNGDNYDVTLANGSGDSLPTQYSYDTYGISPILAPCANVDLAFDGDQIKAAAAHINLGGHCLFKSFDGSGDQGAVHNRLLLPNEAWFYADEMGRTNPLAGDDVVNVVASNLSTTVEATFKLGILLDSDFIPS